MRFALFGDHAYGLSMARALAESGRHELRAYAGAAVGVEFLRRWGIVATRVSDIEEALADPAIDAVIVAGSPAVRPAQLRRALQSERHVLCVHPAGESPDLGYEAAMLETDTGQLAVPLLPAVLHPALHRFRALLGAAGPEANGRIREHPGTRFRLLQLEHWSTDAVLLDAGIEGHRPGLPDWDILRFLGGEIGELSGFSVHEELSADEPVLIAGCFTSGELFQITLVPHQAAARWHVTALGRSDRLELVCPEGWPSPATVRWQDAAGELREETWEHWNPWPALVEAFEWSLDRHRVLRRQATVGAAMRAGGREPLTRPTSAITAATVEPPAPREERQAPTWHDAVRGLELDDAVRRSIERRRSSTLEYQEATEEAGFKGTMTLVGCGLLWSSLFLLILSVWIPWLGWAILPVFGVFLVMQILRWIVPSSDRLESEGRDRADGSA